MDAIHHGGNLRWAEQELGISAASCIDLSTGVSPWVYPVGNIPEAIWQRLPYDDTRLKSAAAQYYRCPELVVVPVSGSQDAIRRLPRLLASIHQVARVALPALAYQEHRVAWEQAGHELFFYANLRELEQLLKQQRVEHVVVVNPNNPSTELIAPENFLDIMNALPEGGYFIADEAFMDVCPGNSLAPMLNHPRLIVLRSIGKFFGLAGLRLGFVLGCNPIVKALSQEIAPWGVSHPALWIGEKALRDDNWQRQQRSRIAQQSQYLMSQLALHFPAGALSTAGLFTTVFGKPELLKTVYLKAAEANILLRFEVINKEQAWLRIGLPGRHENALMQFFAAYFKR